METTAVFIPTLGRPDRVPLLLDNLRTATSAPIVVYFILERDDAPSIEAVQRADARLIFNDGPGTYASCMNTAYRKTDEPFFFLGADDIVFRDGWLEMALAGMADPAVGVVGTEDPLHPARDHSTHSLIRREYIKEQSGCTDLPDTLVYPYWHGFTDHELICVAKSRGAYVYREDSKVEHHHPGWDSLGRVRGGGDLDATYRKGNRHHRRDIATFIKRSEQWRHRIEVKSPADRWLEDFISKHRGLRGLLRYALKRG